MGPPAIRPWVWLKTDCETRVSDNYLQYRKQKAYQPIIGDLIFIVYTDFLVWVAALQFLHDVIDLLCR